VEHQGRDADLRRDLAQVGVQVEVDEQRGRLGRRRLPLHARVLLDLLAARVRVEQAREHLCGKAPVDPGELDERRAHRLGDVAAAGIAAEVDDPLDLERVAHREHRSRVTAAARGEDRGPAADGVDHRLELAALRLDRRARLQQPVAETAAEAVEADDPVGAGELEIEGALGGVRPLLFEVRDPARADHERRALAVRRVREPATVEDEVPDLLLHGRTA
jgi:hypothetical protein